MATTFEVIDEPSHQPIASSPDLGEFHAKYQEAGDTHPLQPLLRYLSQSNMAAQQQRQHFYHHQQQQQQRTVRSQRRQQELRAKRHRLRELQALEYQDMVTPRKVANPGPVGLLGFGMTTVLLNLHNTGHFSLDTVIPAVGICFGGGAQFIAGLLEWTRGNTFAAVAFVAYGSFWLSLVCVWMLPNSSFIASSGIVAASDYFLGAYLCCWGVFTFFMTLCTLRMNVGMFLLFFTLTLLFFWLGIAHMADNTAAVHACGYEGIVCGCIALYLAFAEVLNEVWDRVLLPVVPMTQLLGWFGAESGEKRKKRDGSGSSNTAEEHLKHETDIL